MLSQLEADVLVYMAPHGCTRADVLEFIRHHHEGGIDEAASALTEAILARWFSQGWLEGDDSRIWISRRARREIAWLPLPAEGALEQVEPPDR